MAYFLLLNLLSIFALNEQVIRKMRSRIYTLKTVNGKPILSFDLGLSITFENTELIRLNISDEIVTLKKSEWVNKNKIFDNGKVFFIVASKWLSQDYAFKVLMSHAVTKINSRIDTLNKLKEEYAKYVTAA